MTRNALKVFQFIVLMKNKEADPIYRKHIGQKKPLKMGKGEKNVLIDDMTRICAML